MFPPLTAATIKPRPRAEDLLGARQPNRRPPATLTATVAPPGELLERQSHEHRHMTMLVEKQRGKHMLGGW